MGNDPYRTLGLERNATQAEVRAAFRRRVQQRHPDTATQSPDDAAVRDLIAAYHMLIDPVARARYDDTHPPPEAVAPQADSSRWSSPALQRQTNRTVACPSCGGAGRAHEEQTCPACGGTAEITALDGGPGRVLRCAVCRGVGSIRRTGTCAACGGLGRVRYHV